MRKRIPESRAYVHEKCGGATSISNGKSDRDFTNLCNPFSPVGATFCVNCGTHFPLREFSWEDTGEGLDEYRARLRDMAPPGNRFLLSPSGCLVGMVAGAALGAAIGAVALVGPLWGAGIGAFAGLILIAGILGPRAEKRLLSEVYGVEDYRQLK
jgi:hypothetical protein